MVMRRKEGRRKRWREDGESRALGTERNDTAGQGEGKKTTEKSLLGASSQNPRFSTANDSCHCMMSEFAIELT